MSKGNSALNSYLAAATLADLAAPSAASQDMEGIDDAASSDEAAGRDKAEAKLSPLTKLDSKKLVAAINEMLLGEIFTAAEKKERLILLERFLRGQTLDEDDVLEDLEDAMEAEDGEENESDSESEYYVEGGEESAPATAVASVGEEQDSSDAENYLLSKNPREREKQIKLILEQTSENIDSQNERMEAIKLAFNEELLKGKGSFPHRFLEKLYNLTELEAANLPKIENDPEYKIYEVYKPYEAHGSHLPHEPDRMLAAYQPQTSPEETRKQPAREVKAQQKLSDEDFRYKSIAASFVSLLSGGFSKTNIASMFPYPARMVEFEQGWYDFVSIISNYPPEILKSISGMQTYRGMPEIKLLDQLILWCKEQVGNPKQDSLLEESDSEYNKKVFALFSSIAGMQNGKGMPEIDSLKKLISWCGEQFEKPKQGDLLEEEMEEYNQKVFALFRSVTGMQSGKGIPKIESLNALLLWCKEQVAKPKQDGLSEVELEKSNSEYKKKVFALFSSVTGMQHGKGAPKIDSLNELILWCKEQVDKPKQDGLLEEARESDGEYKKKVFALLRSVTGMQHGKGMPKIDSLNELILWCEKRVDKSQQGGLSEVEAEEYSQKVFALFRSVTGMQNGKGMPKIESLSTLFSWCEEHSSSKEEESHDGYKKKVFELFSSVTGMQNGKGVPEIKSLGQLLLSHKQKNAAGPKPSFGDMSGPKDEDALPLPSVGNLPPAGQELNKSDKARSKRKGSTEKEAEEARDPSSSLAGPASSAAPAKKPKGKVHNN